MPLVFVVVEVVVIIKSLLPAVVSLYIVDFIVLFSEWKIIEDSNLISPITSKVAVGLLVPIPTFSSTINPLLYLVA